MTEELKKLKEAVKSKYTPESLKPKMQAKIDAIEAELSKSKAKSSKKPKAKKEKAEPKADSVFSIAKKIWNKDKGEKWADALKRAAKLRKEGKTGDEPKSKKIKRPAKPAKKAPKKIKRKAKATPKKTYKPRKLKKVTKLTGSTNVKADKRTKALKPGWRKSKTTGEWYYEDRANRSDLNRTKKL